ncbi:Glyoxylate pathway regulator [Candida viswanathii]|jgi:succinate-acetate transporter protein|uniref:Glyoxylate pathway regulator n=1 Tax=Candida viswanathii TaxID=5486 RepID=A0A367XZK6_9ASCO|nr:Glyoxylate pathway regulator [Candida viswanathii]
MSSASSQPSEKENFGHNDMPVQAISYAGEGEEFVILDGKKYYRHELMRAFAGTLNPGLAPYPKHEFGNASAIGLASFALSTFTLGLYYSGVKGIKTVNVVVSLCIFYGGLVEFLAGMWEFFIGNTFAFTVFCSYGAFWITLGTMNVESFHMLDKYEDPIMMQNAVGLFLVGWGIFTFLMLLLTFKATMAFVALFATLDVAFWTLAAGNMVQSATCVKVGGIFCIISACCGWYAMIAGMADKFNSYVQFHGLPMPVFEGKRKSKLKK